ncbi:L,D-transpeptidase family protein [Alkalihalobacterium elongatum]|uniref:L,D-transpeptidase family protein n=1 Tax=Alkalihalobacterium elongatum TaxID=2675466 RepID=UPI001C1F67F5|nr:L,D-transpeptidase family protein [Alkalihalobacterium elongatum]
MSKKSKEHSEFLPRAVRHKKKKKKWSSFILLTVILTLSLGGITAAVLNLGLTPQLQTGGFDQEQDQEDDDQSENERADEQNETDDPSEEVNEEPLEESEENNDSNVSEEERQEKELNEEEQETNPSEDKEPPKDSSKPKESEAPSKETSKPINDEKTDIVIIHEVAPNETLYTITKKYYINPDEQQYKVAKLNNLSNPATDLKVGLKLKLPDPDIIALHKVVHGDTLFKITVKYYGNANNLMALANYNHIINPSTDVKVGMTIQIPHPTLLKEVKQLNGYSIKINKTANTLTVYLNSDIVRTFPVATGKTPSLTPEGTFKIVNKVEKPWYNPKSIPGGDPRNPLGSHWLGLNVPGTNNYIYGIHGTNDPSSIGKHISLGCIRMHNEDVLWMYNTIPLQTPVYIFSE